MNRLVLIIDDDPAVCELVSAILGDEDFEVVAAQDASSGLELARTSPPAVILLDMMMPGIDGIATCRRLKQDPILQKIPVIGITGSEDFKLTEKIFRAGAALFLPKPFEPTRLTHVVELAWASAQHEKGASRYHPRLLVNVPVSCLAIGRVATSRKIVGHTGNASLGGLLLWLPENLPSRTTLRLTLELAEGAITAKGRVAWNDPKSSGDRTFRHGIQLLGFVEGAGDVRYRRFLSQAHPHAPAARHAK
jgi:CheY-like chemotaxis protein